jgi:YD repeat-containing protein
MAFGITTLNLPGSRFLGGDDPLNHLTQLVSGDNTYKFNYDSQGNRVSQSVNGAWTYYDLDLNAGLTQVLTAQDEDYLLTEDLSLVAQNDPNDIEYRLTDGLGSVLQIVYLLKFIFPAGSATPSCDVCSIQSA